MVLWLQFQLSYRKPYSDRRTLRHKLAFGIFRFAVLPAAVVGSLALVVVDDQAAKDATTQRAAIKSTLDRVAGLVGVTAPADIAKAVEELKKTVGAQQRELATAEQTIRDLEVKAEKAAQGMVETFDYNGARRISSRPGHINLVEGPEVEVYRRMIELQGAQKWTELRVVAEKQTRTTPAWLTPYLFLGVAYANLGNRSEALRAFQHVVSKAHGDPAYAEAEQLMRRLQAAK